MTDRLVFPPAKAATLPFPPGCSVSFVGSATPAADAIVLSAFIDLSSDRTTNYEVLVRDHRNTTTTTVVTESQLRYAIDCPVQILSPTDGGGAGGSPLPIPGIIISRPYGGDPAMYSAQIVAGGRRGEVVHSLTMEFIQYRHPVEMLDAAAPAAEEEDGMIIDDNDDGDDDDDDDDDREKNASAFAVPTEVIVSTTSGYGSEQRKGAADNSLDGSMLFPEDYSAAPFEDLCDDLDGKDTTKMTDQGGSVRIPRKPKKPRDEDKENGQPNTPASLIRHDDTDPCAKRMKMDQSLQESRPALERLRIPSFIGVDELRRHSWKLKQLGDETYTAVDIEVAGNGHDDGAVCVTVGAKGSQSDVPRCCWGVEDVLYETLPDCLRRLLLFDIMVFEKHGIFDASRVPWEGRTPGTTDPLIVYVERGPEFIQPKSWLGVVSIPYKDIGGDWRDSVYSLLLGHRGRKHQELLRQFSGSRISVVLRDCRDFPHVSVETYSRENLIAAMHHIRGELTKIMKT